MKSMDPVTTNPDKYRIVFENQRVRVLEYKDKPGDKTTPHHHPDAVTISLSSFDRKLYSDGKEVIVNRKSGDTRWQPAQVHTGENIGNTDTHVILIELKEIKQT